MSRSAIASLKATNVHHEREKQLQTLRLRVTFVLLKHFQSCQPSRRKKRNLNLKLVRLSCLIKFVIMIVFLITSGSEDNIRNKSLRNFLYFDEKTSERSNESTSHKSKKRTSKINNIDSVPY